MVVWHCRGWADSTRRSRGSFAAAIESRPPTLRRCVLAATSCSSSGRPADALLDLDRLIALFAAFGRASSSSVAGLLATLERAGRSARLLRTRSGAESRRRGRALQPGQHLGADGPRQRRAAQLRQGAGAAPGLRRRVLQSRRGAGRARAPCGGARLLRSRHRSRRSWRRCLQQSGGFVARARKTQGSSRQCRRGAPSPTRLHHLLDQQGRPAERSETTGWKKRWPPTSVSSPATPLTLTR